MVCGLWFVVWALLDVALASNFQVRVQGSGFRVKDSESPELDVGLTAS